jgi:hypothetical protein
MRDSTSLRSSPQRFACSRCKVRGFEIRATDGAHPCVIGSQRGKGETPMPIFHHRRNSRSSALRSNFLRLLNARVCGRCQLRLQDDTGSDAQVANCYSPFAYANFRKIQRSAGPIWCFRAALPMNDAVPTPKSAAENLSLDTIARSGKERICSYTPLTAYFAGPTPTIRGWRGIDAGLSPNIRT